MLETLLGWVQPTLGFVSATLVAIIALMFGAMFVFFSGASALVLGQFARFSRDWRVGLTAVAVSTGVVAPLSLLADPEAPAWVLPLFQCVSCLVCWGALALGASLRIALIVFGLLLGLAGGSYVLAFSVEALELPAQIGLQIAALGIFGGVLGLWPLVLGGLVAHRIARPVEWFISLRYLVAKRRQTFISIITVICVTGVALGVAVITVVLSVMNGFSRVWEDKILGTRAHFVVHARTGTFPDYESVRERVRTVPGVLGATPFLQVEAILRGEGGELEPVLLKGIDPKTVQEATKIRDDMISGSIDDLDAEGEGGSEGDGEKRPPGIVIGVELADRYLLRTGDTVILISPMGGPSTPLGPAPRMSRFRVAGVFKSNFFQFDERFAYTSLAGAQKFMRLPNEVSGIEVRTVDPYRSQFISYDVEALLGDVFFARDWKTFYPEFFNALKTERVMMFVLLSFIMVVAGFIIIATLIMMIMEKSRDIAILKTMGCENEAVLRVFAIEGFLIGVGGLALGLGMGLVITWNLDLIQLMVERLLGVDVLPANIYQLQQLPYDIVPWHLVLISAIAMVLSIGATLLPSWQAARLDPAEALRYE